MDSFLSLAVSILFILGGISLTVWGVAIIYKAAKNNRIER